jgi:CelD/BcsL family acetyltransferase involved in cellulose biosynthesis
MTQASAQFPVRVHWISSMRELDAWGERYDRLVAGAGDGGIFYEREWTRRVEPVFAASGAPMAFLLAEADGRAQGLLPLQLETKPWRKAGLRRLFFWGNIGGSYDNGVPTCLFADPSVMQAVCRAWIDFLLGPAAKRWDVLNLGILNADSPLLDEARRRLPVVEEAASFPSFVADLADGYDAYWKRRHAPARRSIERLDRRLREACGRVEYSVLDALSPERRQAIAQLHRRRMNELDRVGRQRVSLFDVPVQREACMRLLDWAEASHCARHYLLEADGELIAFLLGFHRGKTEFLFITAFHKEYERFSPGKLMLRFAMETEATHYRMDAVDMFKGANLLKIQFCDRQIARTSLTVLNAANPLSRWRWRWLSLGHCLSRLRHAKP